MFKYKFKVRVKHHSFDSRYYVIEYAYYRIFKIWNVIQEYISFGGNESLSTFNPVLLNYTDAIDFAKSMKTIDDVYNHYVVQIMKKRKSDEEQENWYKRNVPFNTKEIL